jgi:hypothetical protein
MNFINYKNNFNTLKYGLRISKFSQNNDYNYTNINTNDLSLCQGKSTYVNANPINNNRLTLSNTNNNSSNKPSNRSYIGIYDKPGGYQIITTNDCCDNIIYIHTPNLVNNYNSIENCNCNKIKRYTTVSLDNSYNYKKILSNREYLINKNKTYNQNLPMTNNINLLQEDCIQKNNINIIFVPSNKKFQTQGSVTSSTKILNAKYSTLNKYENNKNNLDPKKDNLDKIINDSCCKPINLSYKKRIRILK